MAEEILDIEDEEDEQQEGNEDILTDVSQSNKSSLLTNRNLIIAGVVLFVVLVGVIFFVTRGSNNKNSNMPQSSIQMQNSQEKKVKKKKKKIKYIRLFSQLESSDVTKILKELSIANINFSTEQTGQKYSVLIDQDQLDEARNLLALKGLPAGTYKQGFELLDDAQTLGVTEFDKRIRFMRALSGEIEKAINQIDIVEACKVQIVQPEQRLFTVTQPPVTASILLRLQKGYEITDEVVYSIIQLTSNA
ncbi:hypothetical protein DID76_04430, partial [Candidatus Marinamargulisbacteria bacterium SCGC AG-414-C22]